LNGKNLTDFTQGNILRHLVFFSLPILAGNLLQALYHTVDSFWVGRFLGPEALAAVSISFPIVFTLISLIIGFTIATTTMVSQYAGAKAIEMVRQVISNSLFLLLIMGLITSIIGVLLRVPLLDLIRTPKEVMPLAADYLAVFLSGLTFMFLFNAVSAILRGLGDAKTPLKLLAYSTILNIILDPLLIFGFGPIPAMGVTGAGLATVIAMAFSAVLGLWHLHKLELLAEFNFHSILNPGLTLTTFKIGLPAGIQHALVSLGFLAITAIVNSFGKVVVAAYGAATRLDGFAFLPAMTISFAVSAIAGQNLGAGQYQRTREVLKWSCLLSTGVTVVIVALILAFPKMLLSIFTSDQQVIRAGTQYLYIVAFSYLPFSLMFCIHGLLRGAGDNIPVMLITLISMWVVRVPLAIFLVKLPALGITGVWLALLSGPVIGLLLSWAYYLSGRWKEKILINRQETAPD
jgi:putative MATE family efflux protein